MKFEQIFENVIVSGDIHGDIMPLVFKVNETLKIQNSLIIVAGDSGIGFHEDGYYTNIFSRAAARLKKKNNVLLLMRGNHDDPDKWNNHMPFKHYWQDTNTNVRLVKDYTVISASTSMKSHNILCVGGAISIDRTRRTVGKNFWPGEIFVYDEEKVKELTEITDVITHSCPHFCEPILKTGIESWMTIDKELEKDCDKERQDHTLLYNKLKESGNPLRTWTYGHMHYTHTNYIDDVKFSLIDIMELREL